MMYKCIILLICVRLVLIQVVNEQVARYQICMETIITPLIRLNNGIL